jgi:hypothetical protein
VVELENDGIRLTTIDTRMGTEVLNDVRPVPLTVELSRLASPSVVRLRIVYVVMAAIQ